MAPSQVGYCMSCFGFVWRQSRRICVWVSWPYFLHGCACPRASNGVCLMKRQGRLTLEFKLVQELDLNDAHWFFGLVMCRDGC